MHSLSQNPLSASLRPTFTLRTQVQTIGLSRCFLPQISLIKSLTPPGIVAYILDKNVAYVTPAANYEQAIAYIQEAFPVKLRGIDPQRIRLSLLLCSVHTNGNHACYHQPPAEGAQFRVGIEPAEESYADSPLQYLDTKDRSTLEHTQPGGGLLSRVGRALRFV